MNQTNVNRNGDDHMGTPYCFAGEYAVPWFMNQTRMDRNGNDHAGDPLFLLENGSMGS